MSLSANDSISFLALYCTISRTSCGYNELLYLRRVLYVVHKVVQWGKQVWFETESGSGLRPRGGGHASSSGGRRPVALWRWLRNAARITAASSPSAPSPRRSHTRWSWVLHLGSSVGNATAALTRRMASGEGVPPHHCSGSSLRATGSAS